MGDARRGAKSLKNRSQPVPISWDAMVGAGSWRDLADHPFSPHRARSYVEGDWFCGRRTRTLADRSLCCNHAHRSGETLSADPGLEPKEIVAFAISKLKTETEQDGHRFAERFKDYTCPQRA